MKKALNEWKYTIVLGFLILMVAIGLRLYNLDSLPIFGDEAIYIRWAQVMRAEPTLRFLPLSDGKQPLFMWLIIPFFKVFSDPLFSGRVVSVLAGMGTLVGIFSISYYLFESKKAALIASLMYAISPLSVFFDRMALVDSLLTMFGVWTLFFGITTAKTLRLDYAMITGFALGGGLLTKSPATFFALLLPITWIYSKWPSDSKKRVVHLIKLSSLLLATYLIAYGMFNILRLGPNFQMLGIRNGDYIYPLTHIFERPLDPLLPFLDRTLEWIWILGPSAITILGLAGILLNSRRFPKEVVVPFLWFFVPILVQSEFAKVFTARYILFTFPPFLILAASCLLGKRFKYILTVLVIVFIFHALLIDHLLLTDVEKAPLPRSERSGYLEEWTSGYGIAEVAELIRGQYMREPDKKIVVGTEGYFGTLPDGLQIYLNDLRDITVIGVGITLKDVPQSLIDSKKAGNKTYLVINSTRFSGDPGKLGLNLLAVYPKAVRPDGSRETLLFFEVTSNAISYTPR